MLKYKYYWVIIIIQMFLLVGLILYVLQTKLVLNETIITVAPIAKENIVYATSSSLNNFYEFTPGVVHQTKPEWLGDYNLLNTINNDTLNERFDYATITPIGTYRIVVLGDSWTYGQYTSTKDNYTEQLEDLLNAQVTCGDFSKFEVINLGIPNYDIAFAYERFRIRGHKYNPDAVIWFMHQNDFNLINDYLMDTERTELEDLKQHASAEQFGQYNPETGYKGMFVSDGTDMLRVEATVRAYDKMNAELSIEKILSYQSEYFKRFTNLFKKPTILYSPTKVFDYGAETLTTIRSFGDSAPNVTVYESPITLDRNLDLYPDFHPNPHGHGLIAKDLMGYLLVTELAQCNLKSE